MLTTSIAEATPRRRLLVAPKLIVRGSTATATTR
jgi:hypothetical protein